MSNELFWTMIVGAGVLLAASWKWTLPLGKAGVLILIATTVGLAVGWVVQSAQHHRVFSLLASGFCQGAAFLGALAWLFYRDPDRDCPQDPSLILSPADGKVIYIRKVTPAQIPVAEKKGRQLMLTELTQSSLRSTELWQIGISMVFTDVHVNRSPIGGTVTLAHHQPGKFLSLRDEGAVGVNERKTMVIANPVVTVGLVQIASRLVRRIVAYVREGDTVAAGKRIGMIKFGSQVDLFVPTACCDQLEVKVGARLCAGVTVIGRVAR